MPFDWLCLRVILRCVRSDHIVDELTETEASIVYILDITTGIVRQEGNEISQRVKQMAKVVDEVHDVGLVIVAIHDNNLVVDVVEHMLVAVPAVERNRVQEGRQLGKREQQVEEAKGGLVGVAHRADSGRDVVSKIEVRDELLLNISLALVDILGMGHINATDEAL